MTCVFKGCTTSVQNPWDECGRHRELRVVEYYSQEGAPPMPVRGQDTGELYPSVLSGLVH